MKTTKQNKSKSLLIVKTSLTLVVGGMLFLSIAFNQLKLSANQLVSVNGVEQIQKQKYESYLTSEFLKFKNEKLSSGEYTKDAVSDKVIFKAFVKVMKAKGFK